MKKLFGLFFAFIAILTMVACGSETGDDSSTTSVTKLEAPVITLTENVVSWDAVENAGGYVVKINDTVCDEQTETSYTVIGVSAGSYEIKVKAMPSDTELYKESSYSDSVIYTKAALTATTVYFVGDSTVCEFDEALFYQRVGYGTASVFKEFLASDVVTVKDYAISGRSSKSFITEDNYATVKNNISAGDYLIIGFGHNDEKVEDAARGTYPDLPESDPTSFKYYLYNYYIKLAQDKGATPILCTPITRLDANNEYTGSQQTHITSAGDYPKAIREVAAAHDCDVIDLTAWSIDKWKTLGYDEAKKFHSVTAGNSQTEPNWASVDTTHINIFGAKTVDYYICQQLKALNNSLGLYVKDNLTEPTEANDLVEDSDYTYVPYEALDWTTYEPVDQFKTITANWYGTAFGDTGGDPGVNDEGAIKNGYVAYEQSAGTFVVGQYSGKTDSSAESTIGYTGTDSYKGKISGSTQGFAFLFTPVSTSRNFTITAQFTVTAQGGYTTTAGANTALKQDGFGLMLSDTAYVPTNNKGICDYVVTASIQGNGTGSSIFNWARQSAAAIDKATTGSVNFKVGDTGTATLQRVGQIYYCTFTLNGASYTTTYTDYYFNIRDIDYYYVGMFGTRGSVATWTNVVLTDDGDAGQA